MINDQCSDSFEIETQFVFRATLDCLGGEYEVEAGFGSTRDTYLRDNAIDTFFIIPPNHRRKVILTINDLLSQLENFNKCSFFTILFLAFTDEYSWCTIGPGNGQST